MKKQNFNGGWIKASQEAVSLLMKANYEIGSKYPENCKEYKNIEILPMGFTLDTDSNKYFVIFKGKVYLATYGLITSEFWKTKDLKQFYINNGALSWDKPSFTDELLDSFSEPIQLSATNDLNDLQ